MKHVIALGLLVLLSLPAAMARGQAGAPPPADEPREVGSDVESPPDPGAGSPESAPPDNPPPPEAVTPEDAPPPAEVDEPSIKAKPEVQYGLGVSGMYNLVPPFFFKAFTEFAKSPGYGLYQPAFGIHFVRRKALMDMTIRVMFGFYHVADGNYLGKDHKPEETDYVEFENMNFLWADITWTWHTRLAKGLYLAYGAGIGIGWVTGSVYTTPSEGSCEDDYGDLTQCAPVTCTDGTCTKEELIAAGREKEGSVPPVLPAITGLIGLRYDFFRHLTMRLDTGIFLPGLFYVQLGLTAMF